jgi:hypothetical protein
VKTQEEFLQEILDLKKANPEMDIHFCIDSDELGEYGWIVHKIIRVEISPWYREDERILVDEDDILNKFYDDIDEATGYVLGEKKLSDEEFEKRAQAMYAEKVKKAILVFTMPE